MSDLSKHGQFAICVTNDNCDDLQVLKVYRLLPNEKAAEDNYIRIIDDSGEDYLYPASCFVTTEERGFNKLHNLRPSSQPLSQTWERGSGLRFPFSQVWERG